jgi:glycosyltransferase involved in cell wall biosynthesis
VIVPVLFGSGTRLKVIEAMAYRRPVVATAAGAEGLPVAPGVEYFAADEPEAFSVALRTLDGQCQREDLELERMLDRARRAVAPLLWPAIVRNLTRAYEAEIAAAAVSREPWNGFQRQA